MNIVPAKIAGVEKIIMCTPVPPEGKVCASTLVAAREAGVDEIYKAGGAQAIAAMAFGTESVPKVDKIVGPGKHLCGSCEKGRLRFREHRLHRRPSEILVLADEIAIPVLWLRTFCPSRA